MNGKVVIFVSALLVSSIVVSFVSLVASGLIYTNREQNRCSDNFDGNFSILLNLVLRRKKGVNEK